MGSIIARLWYPKPEDVVWARWIFLFLPPVFLPLLGLVLPFLIVLILFFMILAIRGVVIIRSSLTLPATTKFSIIMGKQLQSTVYILRAISFCLPVLSLAVYFFAPKILFIVFSASVGAAIICLSCSKIVRGILFPILLLYILASFIVSVYQAGFAGGFTWLVLMLIVLPEFFSIYFRLNKSDIITI